MILIAEPKSSVYVTEVIQKAIFAESILMIKAVILDVLKGCVPL